MGSFSQLLCAAVCLSAWLTVPSSASAIDVYIVAGQSNGWRISHLRQSGNAGAGSSSKVHYFGMKCVSEPAKPNESPVISDLDAKTMGYGLADSLLELSNDDIIFVQFCRCGSGLWNREVNGGEGPGAAAMWL